MPDAQVTLKLPEKDVRSLLFLIRQRQDDCQRVTEDCATYKTFYDIEVQLEVLKMKIAKQIA